MKKIILVFGFFAATLTANAQGTQRFEDGIYSRPGETTTKHDNTEKDEITVDENGNIIINGVEIHLVENYRGYIGVTTLGKYERGRAEYAQKVIKEKSMKLDIPECNYEAFKTAKGKWLLIYKGKAAAFKEIGVFNHYVFFLYETEDEFEDALSTAVSSYQEQVMAKEKERKEAERRKQFAESLF